MFFEWPENLSLLLGKFGARAQRFQRGKDSPTTYESPDRLISEIARYPGSTSFQLFRRCINLSVSEAIPDRSVVERASLVESGFGLEWRYRPLLGSLFS
jgi:hypothetical protein